MRVVWADDALLDIERHTGYIAQFNPIAAAMVAIHPYILGYEATSTEVVILRVWHGGQQR